MRILSLALVSIIAALVLGVPATASADTPRCATFKEHRKVTVGMAKTKAHRIFDIRGQAAGGGAGGYTRFYPSCEAMKIGGGDGGAYVTYDGLTDEVLEKRWVGYV